MLVGCLASAGGYSGNPIDSRDECLQVEGFSEILCMAFKQDNAGPHDVEEVRPPPLKPVMLSGIKLTMYTSITALGGTASINFMHAYLPACFKRWLDHFLVQVLRLFNLTATNFPEAEVQVSTLDAYFGMLIEQAPKLNLPVVTGEIGDSWIYGAPCWHLFLCPICHLHRPASKQVPCLQLHRLQPHVSNALDRHSLPPPHCTQGSRVGCTARA